MADKENCSGSMLNRLFQEFGKGQSRGSDLINAANEEIRKKDIEILRLQEIMQMLMKDHEFQFLQFRDSIRQNHEVEMTEQRGLLEAELERLERDAEANKDTISSLQEANATLEDRVLILERDAEANKDTISSLQEANATLEDRIKTMDCEKDALHQSLEEAKARLASSLMAADAESELKERELDDANEDILRLQSEINALAATVQLSRKAEALAVETEKNLSQQLQKADHDLTEANNRFKTLEKEYADAQSVGIRIADDVTLLQESVRLLQESAAEADDRIKSLEKELETERGLKKKEGAEQFVDDAKANKKQKINYLTSLKQQINELTVENARLRSLTSGGGPSGMTRRMK